MKLSELRTEVASELQYNPKATSYVDSVTRVINSVYEEICTKYQGMQRNSPLERAFLEVIVKYKDFP